MRVSIRAQVMAPGIWGLLSWCFFCDWALGGPRDSRSLPLLTSQDKLGAVPTWTPPEGAEAALAFLYSGDAQKLAGTNCSRRYEAQGAGGSLGLPQILQGAAGTLTQAANFLNMLLQANDIRESSVEEDIEWYQALVRSVAEGDPKAYRASLTFNPAPGATLPQLVLRATRRGEETLLQDLSMARVQDAKPASVGVTMGLRKRVLSNDLGSLDSPKWPRGDGYVGDTSHVRLSPPFLECQGGQLRPGWLVELSTTFYGLKPDLSPEVRGLVQMDVDLQSVDIDQCATGPGWFSNTHQCDLNSTQCVPLKSHGFILGRYLCRCRPGFYGPNLMGEGESNAEPVGQYRALRSSSSQLLRCHPCPEGCASCVDATPCLVEETQVLRAAVLVCQACCMLAVFLSMLISYHCRRSKTIRASGVILLETILFGSLLLYFPVFILYFKPSIFRCIVLRWVRLLGFVTVYGTITLKLYRVLQLFLSRTAQRGPHLSSSRLLRRLGLLLLLVLCFLAAWTVGTLERGPQHAPLVIRGHTSAGRHFYLCHYDRWDYIMVVAEMLLLCWGSFLCYATRAVPSAFHEPRYMGIALHNELLVSAAFHAARFILVPSLHPDWTLLLFFIHTHGTVTTTLALLFVPKFLSPGVPPREEIAAEVYEDELDLQRSGSCLNSSIASGWSECSLDPGDIRDELKKLYAQLEVHKTKKMAVNNPHLPKKKGSSRRGLGRSFMRCLAEFPEAVARRDSSSLGRGSFPRSSRRRLLSSGVQTPERPSPTLRKSHSTYDHRREQDPPLLDSLLRRKLAKKASRGGSRDSMEVPSLLGFRSASAHNLAVGERLPRAQPPSLQKSLSVVAGSREKALLLASQAYLEESYRLALEREERRKARAGSPARRPSARRLERTRGDSLSPPPSPAKSSSVDSSHASGKLHEAGGRWPPPSPIRHQISTPILALGGACLGDSQTLSPTSTLAPAPALPPMPAPARDPTLLTYICPWENAELPVRAENTTQEPAPGTDRGENRPPARARLFRALSAAVAVEKREVTEGEGAGIEHPEGDVNETDDERHRIFPKSQSLKTPIQQGSMRSLGLAIKALTKSRSSYKEKENGSLERVGKNKAFEEGTGSANRTTRAGRPKPVSKQAALAPCDDEEFIQNQQNTHTSRMLAGCSQEGSKEQEGKPRGSSHGSEKAKWKEAATLRQTRQDPFSKSRDGETIEITPGRERELRGRYENPVKTCPQLPNGTDSRTAEICPWEAPELETDKPDSLKAEASPWHMSKGTFGQDQERRSQEEKRTPEKSGPKGMMVTDQKKPEQQLQDREAVCPWESTDLGGPATQPGPQHNSHLTDSHQVLGSIGRRAAEVCPWEVTEVEDHEQDSAKAEICPWEVSNGTKHEEKLPQEVYRHSLEEKQIFRKAMLRKDEKKLGEWESLCPWESTDFRGPSASPTQTPVTSEFSESVGNKVAEVCPWEMEEDLSSRKAEICPWEMNKTVEKGTPGQETGGELVQEKERVSGKESYGEAGHSVWKEAEKQQREAACPWEGKAPEALPPQSELAKVPGFIGSRTAEICPWEVLEPSISKTGSTKEKTYPLEMREGEAEKRAEEQNKGECLENKGESKESTTIASKKLDELTETQEVVCPWEIASLKTDAQKTGQATVRSQVSGSTGSKAAEVCPWEVQTMSTDTVDMAWKPKDVGGEKIDLEIEVAKDSHGDTEEELRKSGLKETAVPAQEKTERLIPEREATCPRENSDGGDSSLQIGSQVTGQLKAGFQELSASGSRTADVCPWEVEAALSSAKAEICPWEVNEEATQKRELGKETDGQSKDRGKTTEKGSSGELGGKTSKQVAKQESVCPWDDSMHSFQAPVTCQSSDSKVAEVCPWEVEEDASNKKAEICPWEVSDRTTEKGRLGQEIDEEYLKKDHAMLEKEGIFAETQHHPSREGITLSAARESICPWEDSDSEGLSIQTDTQGTVSSQNLGSAGSRVIQVYPWEATEPQVDVPGCNVAEICSWEVSKEPTEKVTERQDHGRESQEEKRKPSKKSDTQAVTVTTHKKQGKLIRQQETVYLWESTDLGDDPHDTAEPKVGSQVFEGTEDKMSPSKAEDPQHIGKTEICPWEMSKGAEGTDVEFQGLKGKTCRKGSSRETGEHISETEKLSQEVCPWERTDPGGDFLQPDKTKVPCQGSMGSITAEVCPWEGMELGGNKQEGVLAEIYPREGTGALPMKPAPQASEETEAEIPLSVQEKQSSLLVPRPLLPESKISIPEVTVSSFESGEPQNVPEEKPEAAPVSKTSIQEVKGQPSSLSVPRPLGFFPESKVSVPKVTVSSFEGDRGSQNVLEGKPEAGPTSETSIQEVKDQQLSSLSEGQGTVSPEGQTSDSTSPTVSP